MALKDLTREAVISAIAEYDALGREAFLTKYGFSDAKRYWLVWNGQQYPSKAIAGVAHRYVDGQPIRSTAFTGGDASVGKRLQQLGFGLHVVPANPDWSRDEIILALDLYFANPTSIPSKESEQVKSLSSLLNAMHVAMGTTAGTTIRNVNGVYLKLMNLRALDPAYLAQGKVGMQAGGKLEKTVWAEYVDRREKLALDAAAIRSAITALAWSTSDAGDALPGYEGDEGGVVIRLHKRYERDRRLVAEKKKAAKAAGPLVLLGLIGWGFTSCTSAVGRSMEEGADKRREEREIARAAEVASNSGASYSDVAVMAAAKQAVKRKLLDERSARFRDVSVVVQASGMKAVCGEVNSKNRAGGYAGYQHFISAGTESTTYLEEQVPDFAEAWNQLCVK